LFVYCSGWTRTPQLTPTKDPGMKIPRPMYNEDPKMRTSRPMYTKDPRINTPSLICQCKDV